MSDLIQALKDNRYPFGCFLYPECYGPDLGQALQDKAHEIGKDEFLTFRFNSTHISKRCCKDGGFNRPTTYFLNRDYEAKPDVVECEVFMKDGLLTFRDHGGMDLDLSMAVSLPDFIGFLYEDDPRAYPETRRYRDEDGHVGSYWVAGCEVLTPVAVLFKGENK